MPPPARGCLSAAKAGVIGINFLFDLYIGIKKQLVTN